ncbi:MAG: hypothetical protein PHR30_11520 [Gallionellaceae bacterium]|nr:hypothetical protein [Gallionellaceae bacterium]
MRKLAVLAVLILAACGDKQLTEADFKTALDQGFEKAGPVCVPLDKGFPATLNQMEQEYGIGRALSALEGAGLLTSTPNGKGKRYEVTEAGRNFYAEREGQSIGLTVQKVKHGFMCFADMRVDKVSRWDAQADQGFAVSYTYRLENVAPWATAPSVIQAMPKLAIWVNGAQKTERKTFVKKTTDGLEAVAEKSL